MSIAVLPVLTAFPTSLMEVSAMIHELRVYQAVPGQMAKLQATVLLLEAGGILMTETWFFNQGTEPKFSDRSDADEHPVLVDGIKPAENLQVGHRSLQLRQHVGIKQEVHSVTS
jgi:hypothetical protein